MTLIHIKLAGPEQNGEHRQTNGHPKGCRGLTRLIKPVLGRFSKNRIGLRD